MAGFPKASPADAVHAEICGRRPRRLMLPAPARGRSGRKLRPPPPFGNTPHGHTEADRNRFHKPEKAAGGRNGMFRLPRSPGARPAGPQAPPRGMETDYQSIQKAKSTSAAQTRPFSAFIIAQKAPHGKDNFWYLRKSFSAARFRPLSGKESPGKPRILAGKDTGSAAASFIGAASSEGVSPSVGCVGAPAARPSGFPAGKPDGQTVKKGCRPQKQHKFWGRTTRCRFLLLIYPKYCWPRRGQRFCFLRRAPLTVSIYAYRGALLAPAAFQTASKRVKNIVF